MPIAPLLSHFIDICYPLPYEHWIEIDLALIKAVLRIPGPSKGADLEVKTALECGIPVFYSLDELLKAYGHN